MESKSRQYHVACGAVLLVGVATSLLRWLLASADPYHCIALASHGQWLGQRNNNNWQPNGCMLHSYSSREASNCLNSRPLLFIGDSTTRSLFFTLAHLIDSSIPSTTPEDTNKHADYYFNSSDGSQFTFLWDPFLNASRTSDFLTPHLNGLKKPFLLVLGSGLWYLRYVPSPTGIAQWQANMKDKLEHIFSHAPAEHVVILPVEKVVSHKLSSERAATMRLADVAIMNAQLESLLNASFSAYSTIGFPIFPRVFNDMLNPQDTNDGLHFSQRTLKSQVNILLNRICNDALPKTFPSDKTCCSSYPTPSFLQGMVLVILAAFGPCVLAIRRFQSHSCFLHLIPSYLHAQHISVIGGCVALLYLADRTHVFLKEQKQFEPLLFAAFVILALVVGLISLETNKDQGFLNRRQTDEWKGWMQITILIYHYLGASKISGIYNPIRVLVASYLFMSGYGHCSFYLKKKDYGITRIAQVLTRLNLLTILLAYAMNTSYFDYYFAPVVSFWFIVIYFTMVLGAQHNDVVWVFIPKLILSGLVVYTFINTPKVLDTSLWVLERLCRISWPSKEVSFRINLDLWIVYIGMLCASGHHKLKDHKFLQSRYWEHTTKAGVVISGAALVWFMYFELSQASKFAYNKWHPYISWIPILSFVVLRNATNTLRATTCTAFAFIGTCSLETFIIQFHFWLAADTKGILLMLPGTSYRPLNVVFTTIAFVWVSNQVAISTTKLTDWICGAPTKTQPDLAPLVLPVMGVTTAVRSSTQYHSSSDWVDRLVQYSNLRTTHEVSWKDGPGVRLVFIALILWLWNWFWT